MSVVKRAAANIDGFWSVPASWAWTTVETVGGVGLGRQRSPENHSGPYMRQYVRAANISWSGWELSDVLSMNFDPDDFERFRLHPGDVLLNEGSGSSAEVGKSAIWRGQIEDCCFQNTLLRVQPQAVSPEFLQLYFILAARSGRFVPETQGVNIFHIGKAGLAKFPVPVPPPDEQCRIVAKLDSLRARSGRSRSELDHIPKLIERYKQAILAKAFSGELTKDWRAMRSELPAPTDSTVGAISEISSGVGFPKNRQGKASGDYPFAKVSDISRAVAQANGQLSTAANFVDEVDLASLRANPVPAGSTVFAKIGEALRLNRRALTAVPLILDNNCMALTPNTRQVRPAYLYFFMQIVDLSPFAVATAVPSVRRGDVANLELLLPSLDEQDEILRRMGLALAWLDKIATEYARAEHLLPKLDQAILAKAFRGELVPQDPNDEPASELLQRIKTDVRGGASRKRQ